jgi:hypothetical protein
MDPAPPPPAEAPVAEAEASRGRFRIRVAVLIAVVSIAGAVVAWRASVSSITAAALDQEAEQQLLQQQAREAVLKGQVANDLVVYVRYQEHVKAWRLLSKKADEIRDHNSSLAASFDTQAQGELALARSLRLYFQGGTPDFGDAKGNVVYDATFVLRNVIEGDPQLAVLHPDETFLEAHDVHGKTVNLVAIVALFIAAVFLLTIAQFARRGLRFLFAGAGVLVTTAGFALWAIVEVTQ